MSETAKLEVFTLVTVWVLVQVHYAVLMVWQ